MFLGALGFFPTFSGVLTFQGFNAFGALIGSSRADNLFTTQGKVMGKKAAFFVVAFIALTAMVAAQSSSSTSSGSRKVTERVAPTYPDLARRMHIQGTVKVEAVVRPNGTVKSTRVLGGSPVLVEAATDAVAKWKFEPGPDETTEIIQLTFAPQ